MEAVLLSAGLPGAIIAWFMWRAEGKWDEIQAGQSRLEAALNRQVRMQALMLIASDSTPSSVRQLAQDLSGETEVAEKFRKERDQLRAARSLRRPSAQSQQSQ